MNVPSPDQRTSLLNLRPEIPSIDLSAPSSQGERFQQETLRPILKFQNDLLVAAFEENEREKKGKLTSLTGSARAEYIQQRLQKDQQLRQLLLGMIVGHFTLEEYQRYQADAREIRKRLMTMLVQRLQDQLG